MLTAAAFVLFFGACAVLAFVRHPIYGLYLYLAAIYVHPPSRYWGYMLPDLRWSFIAAVVAVLAIVVNRKKLAPRPVWLANGPAVLLSLYAVWLWMQSAWALDQSLHLEAVVRYSKYLIAFWIVYRVTDSREGVRDLLFAHVMGCVLLGVFAYFAGREAGRLNGVGGPGIDDANTLGMYLATGAIACAGLLLSQRGWRQYACFGGMALILNALVLTNSRGALLGLLAGGVVLGLCRARQHRTLFWSLAVVGALSIGALVDRAFVDRMFTIRDAINQTDGMDNSARSRFELYNAQLQMFIDHPMGSGHRGTAVLSPLYLDKEWLTTVSRDGEEMSARASHNSFMTALVEQGLPGAVMFLALLGWLLGAILRVRRLDRRADAGWTTNGAALCGALMAVFVAGISSDFSKAEVQFWLFAGLASLLQGCSATRVANHERRARAGTMPVGARDAAARMSVEAGALPGGSAGLQR